MTAQTGSQSKGFVMKFVKWVRLLPSRWRSSAFVPRLFEWTHFDSELHRWSKSVLARVRFLCAHVS